MATSSIPALVTNRYLVPGTYIGSLIIPKAGANLAADARACNYIGRGSRLAVGKNLAIRRSFLLDQELTFPKSAPFVATLPYASDGVQSKPTRVFNSITGTELRADQWIYQKVGPDYLQVVISPSAFDQTAVYKIDYQATSRLIKDNLPLADLRTIKAIGLQQDRAQFEDYTDFFIPFSFVGPNAKSTNAQPSSFFTSVYADGGNTGGSAVAIDSSASYSGGYNRFYELECTAASGLSGSFQATFKWKAVLYSGGNNNHPPVPLHPSEAAPTFTADETSAPTLTPTLELGVVPAIQFAGTNFAVGDKFYFNACGPGKIEFDERLANTNQYTDFGTIAATLGVGSTGSLTHATNTSYTGTYNTKFRLKVLSVAGGIGSRTVTFVWAQYGAILGANGTLVAQEANGGAFTLTQGVKLVADFGASTFVAGDIFDFQVKAPRSYYRAKDNRVYSLEMATATNPGADTGAATGGFSTGTPEGGFGTFSAATNLLVGTGAETGYFELPDNVGYFVRNLMRGNVNGNSFGAGDKFEATVTSQNVIEWSLDAEAEEIREVSAFFTDVTGTITGTAGSKYVILNNVYQPGTVTVVLDDTGSPVGFSEIANSRFVSLGLSAPTDTIRIGYRYNGKEPAPGQLYYFTGNFLRTPDLYNVPQLVLDRDEGRTLLGPAETTNHLYIMNELVFDNNAPGAYYTQSFDSDGDGVINTTDIQASLEAHKSAKKATDLCVLSAFEALPFALNANLEANDPFESREQMLWVGAPIGTPIGDDNTPDTLIYLAKNTLQTTPTSPALGTRVLVAPTRATKDIVLDNRVTQTVVLDGSFVAGATSALVNSFADPASTIHRRALTGFNDIQVYTDPQNLLLGGASITWMTNQGSGVFRFEEDITVHSVSEEFQLIPATTQKQYVTRVVRSQMDAALISVVTPSAQAAIALIRSNLAGILTGLVGRGLLAPYQDAAGNVRAFDPSADILIFKVPGSLTKYNFVYAYWIRSSIKQLLGLFAVNVADLTAALSPS